MALLERDHCATVIMTLAHDGQSFVIYSTILALHLPPPLRRELHLEERVVPLAHHHEVVVSRHLSRNLLAVSQIPGLLMGEASQIPGLRISA